MFHPEVSPYRRRFDLCLRLGPPVRVTRCGGGSDYWLSRPAGGIAARREAHFSSSSLAAYMVTPVFKSQCGRKCVWLELRFCLVLSSLVLRSMSPSEAFVVENSGISWPVRSAYAGGCLSPRCFSPKASAIAWPCASADVLVAKGSGLDRSFWLVRRYRSPSPLSGPAGSSPLAPWRNAGFPARAGREGASAARKRDRPDGLLAGGVLDPAR